MPEISIIVPVYQVEQYITRCVESIKNQTFYDYECILVDDGSTDHSGIMCDDFASADPRFSVIHKSNGGLSSSRNAALEVAKGEYLCFLDSDDLIHPQMLELMLSVIKDTGSDLVSAKLQEFTSRTIQMPPLDSIQSDTIGPDIFLHHLLPENFGRISVTACGKLYHKDLFQSLRFPEGKIYEDLHIYLPLLQSCKSISILDAPLYYYYKNPTSITRSNYLAHDRFGEFQVREGYISFFKDLGLREQAQYAENDYLTFFMRNYFAVVLRYPQRKPALEPDITIFHSHLKEILTNPHVCKTRKICAFAMLFFPRIAYLLARRCIPDCLIEEMR